MAAGDLPPPTQSLVRPETFLPSEITLQRQGIRTESFTPIRISSGEVADTTQGELVQNTVTLNTPGGSFAQNITSIDYGTSEPVYSPVAATLVEPAYIPDVEEAIAAYNEAVNQLAAINAAVAQQQAENDAIYYASAPPVETISPDAPVYLSAPGGTYYPPGTFSAPGGNYGDSVFSAPGATYGDSVFGPPGGLGGDSVYNPSFYDLLAQSGFNPETGEFIG